jgi:uncharacterized membrane protein
MRMLFAGESWTTISTHVKGFDTFVTSKYEEGAWRLLDAFKKAGVEVDYMPCHVAASGFPDTAEGLAGYDVVVLSDIGSNTFLLHPETFERGQRKANRLAAIRDYVEGGGGFAMMGGYMSFQGIDAKARYKDGPIGEILPVELMAADDRRESPEGVTPHIDLPGHPVLRGVSADWPHFLGYNILHPKPGAEVIGTFGEDVFMAAGRFGKGRTFAFASDVAPHWASPEFVAWESYERLFNNIALWLAGENPGA